MLALEDALNRILTAVQPLPAETIETSRAVGRILAQEVAAPIDLPPFDNSAMDGYAVVAGDVGEATPDRPVLLRQISRVAAGAMPTQPVQAGQCVRIFTGSPMPTGANAVVMQEDTVAGPDSEPDSIAVCDAVKPWENVRLRGEDIKRGTSLFANGSKLNLSSVAVLGALGLPTIQVTRSPVIGVLATGSELVEPGQKLSPGKIYESNRALVAGLAGNAGAQSRIYPIIPDTLPQTKDTLAKALHECDAVVTSGGVSVGEMDFVKEAFTALGGKTDFWKVAIRPGKPFVFGQTEGKYWFGLPGNPISAMVTFLLLVRPAILKMQGAGELGLTGIPGTLQHSIDNRGDRRHFVRVRIDEHGAVHSTGAQASHMLGSLMNANGLVDIPPHSHLPEGAKVNVLLWDH